MAPELRRRERGRSEVIPATPYARPQLLDSPAPTRQTARPIGITANETKSTTATTRLLPRRRDTFATKSNADLDDEFSGSESSAKNAGYNDDYNDNNNDSSATPPSSLFSSFFKAITTPAHSALEMLGVVAKPKANLTLQLQTLRTNSNVNNTDNADNDFESDRDNNDYPPSNNYQSAVSDLKNSDENHSSEKNFPNNHNRDPTPSPKKSLTEFEVTNNFSFSNVSRSSPDPDATPTAKKTTASLSSSTNNITPTKYDDIVEFLARKGEQPLTLEDAARLQGLIKKNIEASEAAKLAPAANVSQDDDGDRFNPFRASVALKLSDLAPISKEEQRLPLPPSQQNLFQSVLPPQLHSSHIQHQQQQLQQLQQSSMSSVPLFTFGASSNNPSASLFGPSKPLFQPLFTFSAKPNLVNPSIAVPHQSSMTAKTANLRGTRRTQRAGISQGYFGASFGTAPTVPSSSLSNTATIRRKEALQLSAIPTGLNTSEQGVEPSPKRHRADDLDGLAVSKPVDFIGGSGRTTRKRRTNGYGIIDEEEEADDKEENGGDGDDSASKLILGALDEAGPPTTSLMSELMNHEFERFSAPPPPPVVTELNRPNASSVMIASPIPKMKTIREVKAAITSSSKPKSALLSARIIDFKPNAAVGGTPSRPSNKNTGTFNKPSESIKRPISFPIVSQQHQAVDEGNSGNTTPGKRLRENRRASLIANTALTSSSNNRSLEIQGNNNGDDSGNLNNLSAFGFGIPAAKTPVVKATDAAAVKTPFVAATGVQEPVKLSFGTNSDPETGFGAFSSSSILSSAAVPTAKAARTPISFLSGVAPVGGGSDFGTSNGRLLSDAAKTNGNETALIPVGDSGVAMNGIFDSSDSKNIDDGISNSQDKEMLLVWDSIIAMPVAQLPKFDFSEAESKTGSLFPVGFQIENNNVLQREIDNAQKNSAGS
ncbi:hypothetical protein HK100_004405 [Physocladia obscura]|uniref:Uncharacterized protein n=1 Tax=Physocladia obscura TaxID=109957 RepID=A0AAD5T738_9FUNG|nr:hypothetical protein HK100_004405 [Physocladia obscura]